MNKLPKSLGYDRQSYPFVSSDGVRSLMTDAVDDLVLWLKPDTNLPISVSVELIDGGGVVFNFHDDAYDFIAYAKPDSGTVMSQNNYIVGHILWNVSGTEILEATLKANDPQPYMPMYVDPFACIYRPEPALSSVSINGITDDRPVVEIAKDLEDTSIVVNIDDKYAQSVNMYNTTIKDIPITTIRFDNVEGGSFTVNVDRKHVWLKSEAECDLRVCTTDSIIFTEISNDKL